MHGPATVGGGTVLVLAIVAAVDVVDDVVVGAAVVGAGVVVTIFLCVHCSQSLY